ncbi:MAG: hypothetical protein QNI90_14965 [Dinoroseobacter sp.]|nr:hypothetical protein [Dinoroseobacter sp.]MDJ0994876.1 hypothetical protein [Dinoroseobacter sp.]
MTFHERPALPALGPHSTALSVPTATQPAPRPDTRSLPVLAKFQSRCAEFGTRGYVARNTEIAQQLLPAFGVFAQGSQLRTNGASIAIEDADLGDTILDHLGREVTITWIGEVTLAPGLDGIPYMRRVQAERFGLARPLSDVILGAGAEILVDPYGDHTMALSKLDGDEMILPVRPPAAVRMFHIAVDGPQPAFVGVDGMGIRTLDTKTFMSGRETLFVRNFSKLMPGGATTATAEPFVTASPFRRARLG